MNNKDGNANVLYGFGAGTTNVSGSGNSIFGYYSGFSGIGSYNTMMGSGAGYNIGTGDNSLFIGYTSGKYIVNLNNRIVINSLDRLSLHGDTTLSIIYGKQSGTTAGQHIKVNGNLFVKEIPVGTNDTTMIWEKVS